MCYIDFYYKHVHVRMFSSLLAYLLKHHCEHALPTVRPNLLLASVSLSSWMDGHVYVSM